ncbi:unnamed protein product [Paramecium octaurelia]|uniref:TLDc domain-containing protein n=1 Tax=Paramecium octaurelia TaxID=43137 RepID=A0A8S1YK11_PAROT|nr:unnamed protein product [Paramecium octaurelia]
MIFGFDYSLYYKKNQKKQQKNRNQFIQEVEMDQTKINFGTDAMLSSQSGYIFGGYSPCQWQQNLGSYVQDDTLSSFLFSQTHGQIYPLRQDRKYSIYSSSGYGPTFGNGHDIYIASDFKDGYSNLGYAYQWDQYQNQKSSHLFGQDKPNITECEIYELKLI